MNRSLFIFILLCSMTVIYAQKTLKVTATYTYYAPDYMSLEEAKRTALERAKQAAIEDAFGTLVTQSNTTIMNNQNGMTDSHFFSIGGSQLKGEWIQTTKEPEYYIKYEENMLLVAVEVSGRVREIVHSDIGFIAKILRNGTEEKYESCEFRNGDDMYLYFKSPIDGYLAVYLLDEAKQEVFCLLPYKASGEGAYRIEHDKPYILFSAKHELKNPDVVDEYTMTCSYETEYNDIYVIFSPNEFTKANASDMMDEVLPRKMPYKDFRKWEVRLINGNPLISRKNICLSIKKD